MAQGDPFLVEVLGMEFREGGNTIWVHGRGGTVLRIQCTGKVVVNPVCQNPVAHTDVRVQGDISICVPETVCTADVEEDLLHE